MAEYWGAPGWGAAVGWGLCILLALCGWGRVAVRAVGQGTGAAGWLEAAGWGIAMASVVGGVMNLLGWCGRGGLIGFAAVGMVLFAADGVWSLRGVGPRWRGWAGRRDAVFLFVVMVGAGLLGVRFVSSVSAVFNTSAAFKDMRLNPHDDMHSYLVSAERLVQTGTLGRDPFNSRLMMSALGTQHFLNGTALAVLPEERLHVVEGGVGLAALCLAAAAAGLRMGLGRVGATGLMIVPLMVQFWYVNLSATVTASAGVMVLAGWGMAEIGGGRRGLLRWAVGLGFLLAGACSLKGTVVFVSCVFAFGVVVLRAVEGKRWGVVGAGVLAAAMAGMCLLPWMVWQHGSSGTWMYPVLGRGNHAEVFGVVPFEKLKELPLAAGRQLQLGIMLPAVLLAGAVVGACWGAVRRRAGWGVWAGVIAFLAAWTISWPVMAWATQVVDLPRYVVPAAAVGLVVALGAAWRAAGQWVKYAGPVGFAAVAVLAAGDWSMVYFVVVPGDLARRESREHLVAGEDRSIERRVRAMQEAVPAGAKLLVYMAEPAFLDFRRNEVFVVDWPGEASLPPGMPVYSGGGAVAEYLRKAGIRYVAYGVGREAGFSRKNYANYVRPVNGDVVRRQAAGSFAFQDDLKEVEALAKVIYRNGEEEVLDLGAREGEPFTGR